MRSMMENPKKKPNKLCIFPVRCRVNMVCADLAALQRCRGVRELSVGCGAHTKPSDRLIELFLL